MAKQQQAENTAAGTPAQAPAGAEDMLDLLREQRGFLRLALRDLDEAAATRRTTVSELTLAGIVKHVALTESMWICIMQQQEPPTPEGSWEDGFRLAGGETLQSVLDRYSAVEEATEQAVRALPSLDATAPLPAAPWFAPNAAWSARRILGHILRETAQHCGHADIVREALDGATTTEVMQTVQDAKG